MQKCFHNSTIRIWTSKPMYIFNLLGCQFKESGCSLLPNNSLCSITAILTGTACARIVTPKHQGAMSTPETDLVLVLLQS